MDTHRVICLKGNKAYLEPLLKLWSRRQRLESLIISEKDPQREPIDGHNLFATDIDGQTTNDLIAALNMVFDFLDDWSLFLSNEANEP